jgi:CSLREA domain-containing protein
VSILGHIIRSNRGGKTKQNAFQKLARAAMEGLEPRVLLNSYVVTSLNDSGTGTLRTDILAADSASGNSTITFSSTLSGTIDIASPLEINNSSQSLTIDGPGSGTISIDAQGTGAVFQIDSGSNAEIDGLKITGGQSSSHGSGVTGVGGIFVDNGATLSLNHDLITDNIGDYGGGIQNQGTVTITNSTITGNTGGSYGGGIYNNGKLTINNSTISGNSAGGGGGGGIDNDGGVSATIINSTITGNTGDSGGGIENNPGNGAYLYVTDSTIAQNSATLSGHGGGIDGGGAVLYGDIVSANTNGDLSRGTSSGAYNLIGDGTGGLLTSNNNLLGSTSSPIDPDLMPLGNYGGPTETMPLLPDSPALGASSIVEGTTLDQRGDTRNTTHPNIGAVDGLVVNSTADGTVGSGLVTLRDAINAANTLGGNETITFASALSGTIDITSPLEMDDSSGTLTILGPGSGALSIDAQGTGAVFQIDGESSAEIDGLEITGGDGSSFGGGVGGVGGIYVDNDATASLNNDLITDNIGSYGGGVQNQGTLTITNSTISGNTGSIGGGIYNNGKLTVTDSTISGNRASNGGGVDNYGGVSTTIVDSTITGNTALSGGGIENPGNGAYLYVTDSTIADNTATVSGRGGGIDGAGAVLYGDIVAANTSRDLAGGNSTGTHNFIGDGSGGLLASNHNILGLAAEPIDPKLGPLANNGGPTETMALLVGSPAIGAGATFNDANNDPITTDQRGDTVSTIAPNIGAYDDTSVYYIVTTASDDPVSSGQLSLRDAIADADAAAGDRTIVFAPSITSAGPATISLNSSLGGLVLDDSSNTLAINGPGQNLLTISAGGHSGVLMNYGNAEVSGLIITGGAFSFSFEHGGGIENELGDMTVSDCDITGNHADYGAGISNDGGTLTITNSIITGNTSNIFAGGIYNSGSLGVQGCNISDNSATFEGGAVANYGSSATIVDSTITGNTADYGGGIWNNAGNYAQLYVTDSTIAANDATRTNGGGGINGGGTLSGTIVANNTNGDLSGTFNGSYNLIKDGSGGLSSGNHNILDEDPLFGPYGYYGGPTETFALLPGSPALDNGAIFNGLNATPITFDQRGLARGSTNPTDIGAFESKGFVVSIVSGNNQGEPLSTPFSPLEITVSSNDGISDLENGIITFTAPASGASAILGSATVTLDSTNSASDTASSNSTAGLYQVKAAAAPTVGTAAIFSLSNATPPPPPTGVKAIPQAVDLGGYMEQFVQVDWSQATSGVAPTQGFTIEYSEDDSTWSEATLSDGTPAVIDSGSARSAQVEISTQASTWFRVAASNDFGSSAYSTAGEMAGIEAGALRASAVVQSSPAEIQLQWPSETAATSFSIYRRLAGSDAAWGSPIGTALGSDTSYTDSTVSIGVEYEYQIVEHVTQNGQSWTVTADLDSGIDLPANENLGTVILIVDNTFTSESTASTDLEPQIEQYEQDLVGAGWNVVRSDVLRSDTPQEVKSIIESDYNLDPADTKQVILFGHIAVPYVQIFSDPDGHSFGPNGRYLPTDAYYGDMNTDDDWTQVKFDPNDRNYPNDPNVALALPDGETFQPSLAVGRIDMYEMLQYDPNSTERGGSDTEIQSEYYLLNQYLNKDHAFREGEVSVSDTAVWDGFGINDSTQYDAFSPFYGASGIDSEHWVGNAPAGSDGFLFGYGSGSYGHGGFINTVSFQDQGTDDGAIFNTDYGSTLEDWNIPYQTADGVYPDETYYTATVGSPVYTYQSTDPLLLAPIAAPGVGLVSFYSTGGVTWPVYPMAMGASIGDAELYYEHGGPSGASGFAPYETILGDPTLTAFQVAPASDVQVSLSGAAPLVTWTASADSSVLGYDVFRMNSDGTFSKVNTGGYVTGTSFTDTTGNAQTAVYMVRAIKLQETASGTFYDASQGSFSSAAGFTSAVYGRYVFYNDSVFDGNDSAANIADVSAIAPDKTALLPGQTATYSNITNYSNGINGIILYLGGLTPNASLSTSDFGFAVGDSNDTTTWTSLSTSPTVTLLPAINGVTPVDLTWPNGTITNEWLQITVKADSNTQLAANDIFYFGNLVGEVGNSTTAMQVTAEDLVLIQNGITGDASITNPYDINRDGSVSAIDLVLTQDNSFESINLISPTGDGP